MKKIDMHQLIIIAITGLLLASVYLGEKASKHQPNVNELPSKTQKSPTSVDKDFPDSQGKSDTN